MLVEATGWPPPVASLNAAIAALRSGEVVVVPTDTVYGLAALPAVVGATARLFTLKRRTRDLPIAVLCADVEQGLGLTEHLTDEVRRIADRLWPGPLTLVLRRRPGLGFELGEPATTLGVRCPDHDLVRAIAAELGPLATSSANPHGQPTPPTAREVAALFGDGVTVVLDGGPCDAPPSTVVDASGDRWRIVREGQVSLAAIEAAAG